MSDEDKVEIPDLIVEDSEIKLVEEVKESVPERKVSKWEEKALAQGWKPKTDFEGDPEDWRSARDFVERGELFGALNKAKAELNAMKKVYQEVELKSYKKAIDDLKSLHKEAVHNGDVEEATKLVEEIAEKHKKVPEVEAEIPVAASEFLEKNNAWFNTKTSENKAMRQYACDKEVELRTSNPHIDDHTLYMQVEKDVKSFFPHRFEKTTAPHVGTASDKAESRSTTKGKTVGYNDLPDDLKTVFNSMKGLPGITLEGMVKDWKNLGVL